MDIRKLKIIDIIKILDYSKFKIQGETMKTELKERHFRDCVHWDDLNGCEVKFYLPGVGEEEIRRCELADFDKCDSYQE